MFEKPSFNDLRAAAILTCIYHAWLTGEDGQLKWQDYLIASVAKSGKMHMLDRHFTSQLYTANWAGFLLGPSPTMGEDDTAGSHPGWYEIGKRQHIAWKMAEGYVASEPVLFTGIEGQVGGAGIVSSDGVLYGTGAFFSGDQSISATDTLRVVYNISIK